MRTFYDRIIQKIPKERVLQQEPMSRHTSFRIGGEADYFISAAIDEIAYIIETAKECNIPYTVIGNGSNLLVGDCGIKGVVIEIGNQAQQLKRDGMRIKAQAGTLLSRLANFAAEEELGGLEFAAGIPGSVGGAVVMNAGAYGGEIKDIIETATVMDGNGTVLELSKDDLDLGYRHSCISQKGYIVLEAEFLLHEEKGEEIRNKMAQLREQRISKQPLEYPSAGSTFKRPEGYFAGKLIMDANLAGFTVGGAQVSSKHCGFVINTGNATAQDVVCLIEQVKEKVYNTYGVTLEPEIKMLGEFQ